MYKGFNRWAGHSHKKQLVYKKYTYDTFDLVSNLIKANVVKLIITTMLSCAK